MNIEVNAAAPPNGPVAQGVTDSVPDDTSTAIGLTVGGSVSGGVNFAGDRDWFRITLVEGEKYSFSLAGTTLEDVYLRFYDAGGNLLRENDDGGPGLDSLITFTATTGGTYYLAAGAFDDLGTGNYSLSAAIYTPPPVFTLDQIANQLTHEYWGGDMRRFVDADNIITFNVSNLTAEGAALARVAFQMWDDVSALSFQEMTSGAQITFDDNQDDAFADSTTSGTTILSSNVNVGLNWLSAYGTTTDSYSFQTYIHEIGHALGLGHAGDYNGNATYGTDNHYQNDSWAYSTMSYFDQAESGYGSSRYIMTAQMADIVAIQNLYGAGSGTRTGDTVYGHNATAGDIFAFASYITPPAFTIYDTAGNDTLDASGYSDNQILSLLAESFSSIGGLENNIAIARGVVIEIAIGGSGGDTITGNAAANTLYGNDGADTLDGGGDGDTLFGGAGIDKLLGGEGDDTIWWDAADDLLNVLGGNGTDTLRVDGAAPSAFDLSSHGFEQAIAILVDGGGNAWNTITSTYLTGWQLSLERVDNDDTSFRSTAYDVSGALGGLHRYTDYFDATPAHARTAQEAYNDGAGGSSYLGRTTVFYSSGQANYIDDFNASGVRTSQEYFRNDGTRQVSTVWDATGSLGQIDFYQDYFSASGVRTSQTVYYDGRGNGAAAGATISGHAGVDYQTTIWTDATFAHGTQQGFDQGNPSVAIYTFVF